MAGAARRRERGTVTEAVTTRSRPDDYLMGRTPAEHERLRRQARALEPVTRRVLERIGVQPGMSCLDLGCGPGEVMRLLGELVGPSGRVTGIDLDGQAGDQALASLRAPGAARFDFVQGDATTLTELPGHPFDLAYARLVLIHSDDPAGLLRRMYGWVRPGGWLMVQDFDLNGLDLGAAGEVGREFGRVALGVFEAAGRDIRTGQHLPGYFQTAGLGNPDGADVSGFLTPMTRRP